jgi:hypothetical protein
MNQFQQSYTDLTHPWGEKCSRENQEMLSWLESMPVSSPTSVRGAALPNNVQLRTGISASDHVFCILTLLASSNRGCFRQPMIKSNMSILNTPTSFPQLHVIAGSFGFGIHHSVDSLADIFLLVGV